jgi:hypothetical protein
MLFEICDKLNADRYVSSIGAFKYMKEDNAAGLFGEKISVQFLEYTHPTYPQLFGEFVPNMSIVDCLFNCGQETAQIALAPDLAVFHTLNENPS